MKKLVVLLCVALLAGCATFDVIYPPPTTSICVANPDAILCRALAYLKLTPEQANDMLLDASLVPIISKVVKAEELKQAVWKVKRFVIENEISLNGVIKYVVKESEIDPALALLLSRRLVKFQNIPELGDLVFDPVSREMLIEHLINQEEQLSWF